LRGGYAPYAIVIAGAIDHHKPVAGDHGIVYELRK